MYPSLSLARHDYVHNTFQKEDMRVDALSIMVKAWLQLDKVWIGRFISQRQSIFSLPCGLD